MVTPRRTGLEQLVGRIDRRIVYLGLFILTLAPLVGRWSLPLYVTDPPRMLYRTIEALPTDKLVFISSDWDAGSQAECQPQLVAIARHLIRRNLNFAIISIGYPTSPQLAQAAVQRAIDLEGARDRWKYGEQWVNLGYRINEDAWLRSFTTSIPQAVTADMTNTPVAAIPVLRGVEHFGPEGEVSMMIDITGSDTNEKWYQFLGPTRVQIGLGCTAVMAPKQYPYLDSGQLSGLLTGMKGAAEYELLINAPGQGMPAMAGQSFAHLYIFILIALGNLSVLLGLWERRRGR